MMTILSALLLARTMRSVMVDLAVRRHRKDKAERIILHFTDRLTPTIARAALEKRWGKTCTTGLVFDHDAGYGYRIYGKSARKIKL